MNFFYFRVDTSKGRFYAYVEREDEEVAQQALETFIHRASQYEPSLKLVATVPLKRVRGETSITMLDDGQVLCGRPFWYALGRAKEYEELLKKVS